ncbi:MAG: SAM-dependent methyltransferase [Clostridia bacterium]|nr:SAM-dependent methyltransferase [Clostridia bacterium]
MMTEIRRSALELIVEAFEAGVLKKAVFSKPSTSDELKTELAPMLLGKDKVLRRISYMRDGKALQKNITVTDEGFAELVSSHGQINILTTVGDAELRSSKSGKENLSGDRKIRNTLKAGVEDDKKAQLQSNDRKKNRILSGDEKFLTELGISDRSGRIHDKMQHKYRQICRFLEYVEDIYPNLPREGKLLIYDLCCGKSYLSFAIYHYFTVIKKREIEMTGVDLKSDVIEYCSQVASRLGYDGLAFVCVDINEFAPKTEPHLVVSLHACDIATDIVLRYAASHRAGVILSTPCCQRELSAKIDCAELDFVSRYPILRRKMCDALTDSLRLSYLASCGYSVDACELVDPDDTPKNILLRAVRKKNFDPESPAAKKLKNEFEATAEFLLGQSGNTLMLLK